MLTYTHVDSLCDGLHICNKCNVKIDKSLRHLIKTNTDASRNSDMIIHIQAAMSFVHDPQLKTMKLARRNASSSLLKHRLNDSFKALQQNCKMSLLDAFVLPCEESMTFYTVYDYCIIHDKYPCIYGKYSQICRSVLCVGMFKCGEYGCIRRSSMCGGHVDCPSAEDEYNCANISCPGLIKCRNEDRCIGLEQMCHGTSDCIYSSDDEMTCNKCPVGCRCVGYTMQCDNIKAEIYQPVANNHVFSIILKGNITRLFLDKITNTELVSFDTAFCNIQSVLAVGFKKYFYATNVLHANFSNNYIEEDSFLSDNMFSKLAILDIGYNLLTILVNSSFKNLNQIKILQFQSNPVIYISLYIFKNILNLWIINIENVYLLKCKFSTQIIHLHSPLHLKTDDALLCCYFKNTVQCFAQVIVKCYGFIHNYPQRIIMCVFCLLAWLVLILSTVKYLYSLVKRGFNHVFFAISVNINIAEILTCVYISSMLATAWQNVSVIHWQVGTICIILQKILTLALVSNILHRFLVVWILLLKVVYPFKHQCRWLHYIWTICGSIWFISILYTLLMTHQFLYYHGVFCTHWFQGYDNFLPLKISMVAIEMIYILGSIVCIILTLKSLKRNMVAGASCSRNKASRTPFRIISASAVEVCAEAIFRFFGVWLFVSEFAHNNDNNLFCVVIVFFVLQIKMIISVSARHVKQIATK